MPTNTILIGLFFLAFVQEDSAVVSGALLGFKGAFPYWQTFAACFLGMWVSDIGIYFIVKFGGSGFWNRVGHNVYCRSAKSIERRVGLIDTEDLHLSSVASCSEHARRCSLSPVC